MVGSVTDSNGIATEYTYSPAGLVTRIVRKDGADVISSLEVAYDSAGRPVSMKDQGNKFYQNKTGKLNIVEKDIDQITIKKSSNHRSWREYIE